MRNLGTWILGAAAVVLALAPATAQTAQGGAKSKTGAPTSSGAPAPTVGDLDLPIDKPVYQPPAPAPGQTPPPFQPPVTPPNPNPSPDPDPTDPTDRPEPEDPRDEPPPTFYGEEIDSENDTIYYVIDASCSMGWDESSYTTLDGQRRTGPRMDRAKVELIRSITGLSENFKFNIIAYDCSTDQWRRRLVEANDSNKADAIGWVNGQQPRGATGTGPATALALEDRDNMSVVLLTDGEPNCGAGGGGGGRGGWDDWDTPDDHRRMIRRANRQGATINVFGIAASGAQRRFCQQVASDSGGSYFDVP